MVWRLPSAKWENKLSELITRPPHTHTHTNNNISLIKCAKNSPRLHTDCWLLLYINCTRASAALGDVNQLGSKIKCGINSASLCSYTVRIESMLLKEDFPAACEAMRRDIKILRSAIKGNDLAASSSSSGWRWWWCSLCEAAVWSSNGSCSLLLSQEDQSSRWKLHFLPQTHIYYRSHILANVQQEADKL